MKSPRISNVNIEGTGSSLSTAPHPGVIELRPPSRHSKQCLSTRRDLLRSPREGELTRVTCFSPLLSKRLADALPAGRALGARGRGMGGFSALSILILLILITFVPTISAQEPPVDPAAAGVTFDDVNRVAAGMYCPECEYIPLDKCYSPVCVQWKEEIAVQLAEGRTDQEIIDGFVARFGDQVLGIPQDESLRNLSIYVPLIALIVIVMVGVFTFLRWSRGRPVAPASGGGQPMGDPVSDHYRSQLERDLER